MRWLRRLLGVAPKDDSRVIHFDFLRPYWEIEGETTFAPLLRALADLLPQRCILYFESGSPDRDILDFLNAHAIPAQAEVLAATIWFRPRCHHVPATPQNLAELAILAASRAAESVESRQVVYDLR